MQTKHLLPDFSVKKVLLATDFSAASDAAFQQSLLLCNRFGASLYVLNVFEYTSGVPPEAGGLLPGVAGLYRAAESSLGVLIDTARRNGVACKGNIAMGLAHTTILSTLASQSCGLVVLGTRAIRGFERLVFGSTAEAILRKSGRPVFTVGPQVDRHSVELSTQGGIAVFATDFHVATAKTVILAILFARTLHLPLHCLHVLPRALDDKCKPQLTQVIREALQHLVVQRGEQTQAPVCAVTYGSEISTAVIDYARKHDARLIVLGVSRASLAASHVPAHIAYRIITEAKCPVLTMAFPIELAIRTKTILTESRPELTFEPELVGQPLACAVAPSETTIA